MARIGVLVVDDSAVVRRLLCTVLNDDPDISVVGTAASGLIALSKLTQTAPSCVILDIEMPDMDGLATLRVLRQSHPRLPVIMFSTLTERGASATLDALAMGANDYLTKPANMGSASEAMAQVRAQLVPKIKALCPVRAAGDPLPGLRGLRAAQPVGTPVTAAVPASASPRPSAARIASAAAAAPASRVDVLAIGASTGGPEALALLLPQLPTSFPVPVVVVQHMPPVFTRMFAERLDRVCALKVSEAVDGDVVKPGRILIAPGDKHLELKREAGVTVVRLNDDHSENYSRPAVDVTFRSAARAYGPNVLAVVLTGMGTDGVRGAEVLHRAGAHIIGQDEASSVVWGMPAAVIHAGLAHRTLPLDQIASAVLKAVARGRAAAASGVSG